MDLREQFGGHIRRLRVSRGWSQSTLAERSQISVDTLRRIEHGELSPSLHTIGGVAEGLGISLATLFRGFEVGEVQWRDELLDYLDGRSATEHRKALALIKAILGGDGELDGLPIENAAGGEHPLDEQAVGARHRVGRGITLEPADGFGNRLQGGEMGERGRTAQPGTRGGKRSRQGDDG